MNCYLCGSSAVAHTVDILDPEDNRKTINVFLCEHCNKEIKHLYAIKCYTCGSFSFIPITPKSIFYLLESNLKNNIATATRCPNCCKP
jgi:hypothetical protein